MNMILKRLHTFLRLNREYVRIKNCLLGGFHIDQLPESLCSFKKEYIIRVDENLVYTDGYTSKWYICYYGNNNTIAMIEPYILNEVIYEYYKPYIDKLSLNND